MSDEISTANDGSGVPEQALVLLQRAMAQPALALDERPLLLAQLTPLCGRMGEALQATVETLEQAAQPLQYALACARALRVVAEWEAKQTPPPAPTRRAKREERRKIGLQKQQQEALRAAKRDAPQPLARPVEALPGVADYLSKRPDAVDIGTAPRLQPKGA